MFVAIYVHFQRKIYGVKIKKTCWNKNPMKRRSKIREEIHYKFLQARVSKDIFKKYLDRDMSDPNLPFKGGI